METAAENNLCRPIPEDDQPFQKLFAVGPLMATRAQQMYNIRSIGDFKAFVIQNRNRIRNLREFIERITRNQYPQACYEGYIANEYNLRGKLCLVRAMREFLQPPVGTATQRAALCTLLSRARAAPSYAAAQAGETVNPALQIPRQVAGQPPALVAGNLIEAPFHFDPRVINMQRPGMPDGSRWEYPFADRRFKRFERSVRGRGRGTGIDRPGRGRRRQARGVARFPHGYSRVQDLPENQVARNAAIRSVGSIHSNRQFMPCSCFREQRTCEDFSPARVARGSRNLSPGIPACVWADDVCQNAPAVNIRQRLRNRAQHRRGR